MNSFLDYLGSSAPPGTMPAAVPGRVSNAPLPASPAPSGLGGSPSPGLPPAPQQAPAESLGSALAGMLPPGFGEETVQQYQAMTQEDGSVLLHLKKADGSLGPVVQVLAAPKLKGKGGGSF